MNDEVATIHYYHIDIVAGDRPRTENNASLERVVRDIAIPFRLNRPFLVDGYEVRPRQVGRLKIRRTLERIDAKDAMAALDMTSLTSLLSSVVAVGSRMQEGENVTEDILLRADQMIAESGLTAAPVSPVFDRKDPERVFVITSFDSALEQNFDAIQDACRQFGMNAIRTDRELSSESVVERIQRHLLLSTYVVADLTHARPNCYYEIGFFDALLLAREEASEDYLLLVAQDIDEDAHFDLKHRGIQEYDNPFTLMKIVEAWLLARGRRKRA